MLERKGITMISIIVPVFNAAKYLVRCVDSIKQQSMKEWELILVNDGSSDSSGSLCDELAKKDSRIKVIHQKNQGVSSARNAGLDMASGEYIMFVDADDWVESTLCETLITHSVETDVVISGFYYVTESGRRENIFSRSHLKISIDGQFPFYFDELYEKNLLNSPWAKLYRRSLIGNQRFSKEVALGEDLLFNLEYLKKCTSIKVVQFAGYDYNCLNENSATKKLRPNDFQQVIALYEQVKLFQQHIPGDWSLCQAVEKQCCLNEINLLQLLFYSSTDNSSKRGLVHFVFDNKIFQSCAQKCTSLPFKYEIPKRLCIWKSYVGVNIFFSMKKYISLHIKL